MNDQKTIVTIIIPFYNASSILKDCVDALSKQNQDAIPFEIILIDDGSTHSQFNHFPDINYLSILRQENRGPAAARNLGIEHARGDILLFTDSDCIPDPDWVKQLQLCFADPSISGAKGVYRTEQRELTARFVQLEYQTKYRYMNQFPFIDFIDTYSAAYRKSALAHERFDESFPKASVEDQELSFRLTEKGHKFIFCPQAKVCHQHVATPWGYFRKKYKIGFWKAKIIMAQKKRILGDSHTPKSLRLEMMLAPLVLFSWFFSPWFFLVLSVLFLSCNLPLFREALHFDPPLFVTIPFFTLLRAFGLGLGLANGLLYFGGRLLLQRVLSFF